MTRKFVKEHRQEIDACINKHCPGIFGRLNDVVRWDWLRTVKPLGACHEGIMCNKICQKKGLK